MMMRKRVMLCLVCLLNLSSSQYKGVRRLIGLHPGEGIQQRYRSSGGMLIIHILESILDKDYLGQQNSQVQKWLHSYSDLLDQWVAPSKEPDVLKPKMDESQPKSIDHKAGKNDLEGSDYLVKYQVLDKQRTTINLPGKLLGYSNNNCTHHHHAANRVIPDVLLGRHYSIFPISQTPG